MFTCSNIHLLQCSHVLMFTCKNWYIPAQVNIELTSREEELVRLGQRARRLQAKGQEAKSRTVVSFIIIVIIIIIIMVEQVPELEELLSIPAEALQKELCLSREEVGFNPDPCPLIDPDIGLDIKPDPDPDPNPPSHKFTVDQITFQVETLITAITSTMDESKKVERELVAIQERQVHDDDDGNDGEGDDNDDGDNVDDDCN